MRPKADFTDPAILQQVTQWISEGYTEASISKMFGYSDPSTFTQVKKRHPQLQQAIKEGTIDVEQMVQGKLWSMMINDDHPKQFSALVFFAKCKLGWMDRNTEMVLVDKTTKLNFAPTPKKAD